MQICVHAVESYRPCVTNQCYITDVKTGTSDWIIALLALAAFFMVSVAGQPKALTPRGAVGAGSQSQAKTSTKTSPSAGRRKILCKTPENASLCYWTHGRLSVWEGGAPSYRLWKIGTRRLLGVFKGPSRFPAFTDDDGFNPEFPANLDRAYELDGLHWKWTSPPPVFADFEVCPLEQEKKGEMQAVCIESAKNIFIQHDD